MGIGFLTTLGVGFSYPTPEVQLDHFLHHTPKLGIPVEMETISCKTFLETDNSCCAPQFPLTACFYRIVDSQTSFTLC